MPTVTTPLPTTKRDPHFQDRFKITVHVELSIYLFMGLTLAFILIMIGVMMVFRWYYRQQLEIRLKELQQTYEPGRIFLMENANGNEVVQVRPGPLSPPITDQTEYNVVAGYLRDDKRGQLF
ncbi:hypothetical protein GCK72_010583 [Caenorhabditis remanei]|uniref:Uncharacterized protein n=1 Tax=Caenorhabditis remanei TaxID=31234 RepID=E3LYZ6_CAERE|nr:hypothetical protein GCK72_010583 [Caenorhabditis remanei]EFO86596.1 hypothetical protein CRE_04542 [Caenorhabditis remanei]KAF1762321.1 hypothetical protein GCK72_010583 [Caenorhabditis remanei]